MALDPADRAVQLSDGTRLRGDAVVLATGATARRLPGATPAGVHVLRTLDDACALRVALRTGGRLVVIGAGFIGSEVASTARSLGLEVTVVEAAPSPLAVPLGTELGSSVASLHRANGTTLLCGVGVRAVLGETQVHGVELADGRVLPADIVVVGIGAYADTAWLAGSGVRVGNGVECDATGNTTVPHVVAVGDCSAWYDATLGGHHRVEHWTAARDRPALAAAALLGTALPARATPAPYFWSDQYGARIQFAGHAALADSVTVEEGDVESGSFLAVYRRDGAAVGVLGVDQVRLFTRWRRALATPLAPA